MSSPTGGFVSVNGQQIYFEVYGTGEPVLLLHGFSGSSQDWVPSIANWGPQFQLIAIDLRGHGRSSVLTSPFRHVDAAADVLALLEQLGISACKGVGVSGGGNVLLHIASKFPERIAAMVVVSATPYFPAQARPIMRQYASLLPPTALDALRRAHPQGDEQVQALLASATSFADSYDDMNFTPPSLARIQARTLIVQGDRDPFYPVRLSFEMFDAMPNSNLWIIPEGGHAPVAGQRWPEFQKTAAAFLLKTAV